jgi:hypothetical protein
VITRSFSKKMRRRRRMRRRRKESLSLSLSLSFSHSFKKKGFERECLRRRARAAAVVRKRMWL